MTQHNKIWDKFCERIEVYKTGVPLFQHSGDLIVGTKVIGTKLQRTVLCRSTQMEQLVRSETEKLFDDWERSGGKFDGLIYMMFLKKSGKVLPLYIGKAETIGKGNGNLSANIKNLNRDQSKFARWGDNYAYHIGDLSAVVIPGHKEDKASKKYLSWAQSLFEDFPSPSPKLKEKVFFWAKAWERTSVGVWEDFGPTRLTFLEYLMIGVASSVFPDLLLNKEGHNRG